MAPGLSNSGTLNCASCYGNYFLAAISGCGKFTRSPTLQLCLQCDFGLKVAGGSVWSPNGEEGSDQNLCFVCQGEPGKQRHPAQSQFF